MDTEIGRAPSGQALVSDHALLHGRGPAGFDPSRGPRCITVAEFHAELAAQGVGHRDYAFKCVSCGTVQSMNSLVAAGVPKDKVDRYVAFSCEGRWNSERGCDWTLGGLFTIHKLEVVTEDGERHPRFEPATPDEAQALASAIEASGQDPEEGLDAKHESAAPAGGDAR